MLHGGAISWSSKKQTTVVLSTVEAEYVALSNAVKDACWLRQLFKDLGHNHGTTTMYVDNQGAIALTKNLDQHPKTKHIDIRYHFVQDLIENGVIRLEYCATTNMVADILMKGLPRDAHEKHTAAMLGG